MIAFSLPNRKLRTGKRRPGNRWGASLRRTLVVGLSLLGFLSAVPDVVASDKLEFVHQAGTLIRVLTDVDEEVFVDGVFSHRAEILERAVLRVVEVEAGEALIEASYRTHEKALTPRGSWTWGRAEEGVFRKDHRGRMAVPVEATMPVIRDIPVFPEYPVEPGDSWTHPASEVHLFELAAGTAGPFRAETDVFYQYRGIDTVDEKPVAVIDLRYDVLHPVDNPASPIRRISGSSRQTIYWNIDEGQLRGREETFRFFLDFNGGRTLEFRGTQETRVVVVEPLDTAAEAQRLNQRLEQGNIKDTRVSVDAEGLLLTLQDIRFTADSARLPESEKRKLDAIRPLLETYTDRDIVVTGHTAMAGTTAGRLRLSQERAEAVATYLYPGGRRGAVTLMIRGVGAADPAASNDSEEGMALNRRVTILIAED